MINGFFNIKKEAGFTSHDVVAVVRRITHQKKVGHTGTLDPAARGVLPICLGKATRAAQYISDAGKEYRAVLLLGRTTDTQDTTGEIRTECDPQNLLALTEDAVREMIQTFVGEQEQIPPMYSAKKVEGKKLYELARVGKEIERKPCRIRIDEIVIEDITLPRVTFRVSCSSGTYIRTLCHDIGTKLGVGGCMESLVRTRVGIFKLEDAVTLKELETLARDERLLQALFPVDRVFAGDTAILVRKEAEKLLYNGCPVPVESAAFDTFRNTQERTLETAVQEVSRYRLYDADGRFIGLYRVDGEYYKPVRMFFDREEL